MMQILSQGMPFPASALQGYSQLCAQAQNGGYAQLNAMQAQMSWLAYRNVFRVWEEESIAKAKASYPAWFEPASEWDAIP